jgi:hypothetical protein
MMTWGYRKIRCPPTQGAGLKAEDFGVEEAEAGGCHNDTEGKCNSVVGNKADEASLAIEPEGDQQDNSADLRADGEEGE